MKVLDVIRTIVTVAALIAYGIGMLLAAEQLLALLLSAFFYVDLPAVADMGAAVVLWPPWLLVLLFCLYCMGAGRITSWIGSRPVPKVSDEADGFYISIFSCIGMGLLMGAVIWHSLHPH